jgi:hypothetical protein
MPIEGPLVWFRGLAGCHQSQWCTLGSYQRAEQWVLAVKIVTRFDLALETVASAISACMSVPALQT